jgi:hypothetical protein
MARTVRETQRPWDPARLVPTAPRFARALKVGCLACGALVAIAALSGCASGGSSAGSAETSPTVGASMAGPVVDVNVTQEALQSMPKRWVLTTPESAVRSYLDWTSYAYRIGQSSVATATMAPDEEVHVNSYIQYNLQKSRLIDQTLNSITFGKPSVGSTSTLVPAKETWTYRYLSIAAGNEVVGGPFTADYDATYTVVKSKSGEWVVYSVDAKPLGTVQ